MATKQVVKTMITSFCEVFGKRENDKLVNGWVEALHRYRDQQVILAGQKALEECLKMPTPMDVISRISVENNQENTAYNIGHARCSKCNRVATCISEPVGAPYICRECYTGLTNQQISQRFKDLGKMMDDKKFIPKWATWMYLDNNGKRRSKDEEIPF
jgi:hypothetical protein